MIIETNLGPRKPHRRSKNDQRYLSVRHAAKCTDQNHVLTRVTKLLDGYVEKWLIRSRGRATRVSRMFVLAIRARDVVAAGVPWIQDLICDWPQVCVFSTPPLSGLIEIKFWMELTRMWSSLDDAVDFEVVCCRSFGSGREMARFARR